MKTFVATRITNEVSMLLQPLLDQLMQLRLPAMREGLKEQLSNLAMLNSLLKNGWPCWSIWNVRDAGIAASSAK
jgi:hypothetical protein